MKALIGSILNPWVCSLFFLIALSWADASTGIFYIDNRYPKDSSVHRFLGKNLFGPGIYKANAVANNTSSNDSLNKYFQYTFEKPIVLNSKYSAAIKLRFYRKSIGANSAVLVKYQRSRAGSHWISQEYLITNRAGGMFLFDSNSGTGTNYMMRLDSLEYSRNKLSLELKTAFNPGGESVFGVVTPSGRYVKTAASQSLKVDTIFGIQINIKSARNAILDSGELDYILIAPEGQAILPFSKAENTYFMNSASRAGNSVNVILKNLKKFHYLFGVDSEIDSLRDYVRDEIFSASTGNYRKILISTFKYHYGYGEKFQEKFSYDASMIGPSRISGSRYTSFLTRDIFTNISINQGYVKLRQAGKEVCKIMRGGQAECSIRSDLNTFDVEVFGSSGKAIFSRTFNKDVWAGAK